MSDIVKMHTRTEQYSMGSSQKFKLGVSFVGYLAFISCHVVVTYRKDRKNEGLKMAQK